MPAGSRGPRGFADWQRVVNWDGPALISELLVVKEGEASFGVFEVSRFGYLAGRLGVLTNPVKVQIEWFLDEAATKLCGIRQFVLDPEIVRAAALRIPNLGPWVRIKFAPTEAKTKWTLLGIVFATNRTHPLELIPVEPIVAFGTVAFAGKEEVVRWPTTYYAGPVQCRVENGGFGEAIVIIQAEIEPAEFVETDRLTVAAKGVVSQRLIAPTTAWRIIFAASVGATHKFSLTPFGTGSS